MTLDEIKAAVENGETVHWANPLYTVIKDSIGQWLIAYMPDTPHENYVGLTWMDGVTMNGRESEFFIATSSEYDRIVRAEQRMNP